MSLRRGFAPARLRWPALLAALLLVPFGCAADAPLKRPLPAFTATSPAAWLNSPPLRVESLRGKVLLLDVWTFECWNCYRSFPWLGDVERRFADEGLQVIGIHAPEFERERDADAVQRKADEFGLHHPIMIDNDLRYWRALDNHYWPAFYLVDRRGFIRRRFVGETHAGSAQAASIEQAIAALLAEAPETSAP